MSMQRIELDVKFEKVGNEYVSVMGSVKVLGNGKIMMHKEEVGQVIDFSNNGDGTWHVIAEVYRWVLADDE